MATATTFGTSHFGAAQLGHKKRTECLVRIADCIYRHPGGTLPAKFHTPKDYKAMDRLMNRAEVTHAAVLAPHYQRTLDLMYQTSGPVLILHDTTELDYSGLKSITDLGQGQLQLKPCCAKHFEEEIIVPAATSPFHDQAGAAGMLLQQRQRKPIEPGKVYAQLSMPNT
jgi:hypothetical protein